MGQNYERSLGDLVKELAEEGSNLVHAEVRIAEAKLSQRLRMAVRPLVLFAAAGLFACVAVLMLFLALGAWLATMMGWPSALLIVTAIAIALGAALFFWARSDLSEIFIGNHHTTSEREAID